MTDYNPGPQIALALAANETQGLSLGKIVWGRFVRHKAAMGSAIVLTITIAVVLSSIGVGPIPGWWMWSPTDIDVEPEMANAVTTAARLLRAAGWEVHERRVDAAASAAARDDGDLVRQVEEVCGSHWLTRPRDLWPSQEA